MLALSLLVLVSVVYGKNILFEFNEQWIINNVTNIFQELTHGYHIPGRSQFNQTPCQKYHINEIDDVIITNITIKAFSLKYVKVQILEDAIIMKIKLNNITLDVGEIVSTTSKIQTSDELSFIGAGVSIQAIIITSSTNKLKINQSSLKVNNYHFQSKCQKKQSSQSMKRFYVHAQFKAMKNLMSEVLDHYMKKDYFDDLFFYSTPNILQCFRGQKFEYVDRLNITDHAMRTIIREPQYQHILQEDYNKGNNSQFYFRRAGRDEDSEVEINAFTIRSIFPKMNISSQMICEGAPIQGGQVNMTLEEGFTNGTIPYTVNIYEDNDFAGISLYCSFNVSVVINIQLQQNSLGTSPYIEDIDLKDFQFDDDNTKFDHNQTVIFSAFFLRFEISQTNQKLLKNPHLNYFASIQKDFIVIDEIY